MNAPFGAGQEEVGRIIGFVLIKMIAMSLLYATAYLWEGAHRWLIPILMTIAGVWLTKQNTLVYLSLK